MLCLFVGVAYVWHGVSNAGEQLASNTAIYKRMLLTYLQTNAILGEYSTHGTKTFKTLFGWQQVSNSGGISLSPFRCALSWSFFDKLWLTVAAPVILAMTIGFMYMLLRRRVSEHQNLKVRCKVALTMSLYLLYPDMCNTFFNTFALYRHPIDNAQGQWHRHLRADMAVTTDQPEYTDAKIISSVGIAIYVIGIPICMGVLLYSNRKEIRLGESHQYGFLYGGYNVGTESNCYLWECIIVIRKLGISLIAVTLAEDPFMQEFTGSLLILLALIVHHLVQPMRSPVLNNVESQTLMAIYLTQMISILYQKSENANAIVVTIIITFIHVYIMALYIWHIANSQNLRKIRKTASAFGQKVAEMTAMVRANVNGVSLWTRQLEAGGAEAGTVNEVETATGRRQDKTRLSPLKISSPADMVAIQAERRNRGKNKKICKEETEANFRANPLSP